MRKINEVAEHRRHRPEITAVGGRASCIVAVWIHADPVNMVPGIMGELGDERSRRAAVAFSERMHRVHVGEELRYLPYELLAVQATQPVSRC